MFHWVKEASGGQINPSAGTYLEFERLHIVRARSEVSVDQGATTERSTVRVLLQPHAVPLAVATVQTLSVTTCGITVQIPF